MNLPHMQTIHQHFSKNIFVGKKKKKERKERKKRQNKKKKGKIVLKWECTIKADPERGRTKWNIQFNLSTGLANCSLHPPETPLQGTYHLRCRLSARPCAWLLGIWRLLGGWGYRWWNLYSNFPEPPMLLAGYWEKKAKLMQFFQAGSMWKKYSCGVR